ncbi:hypothetical protein G9F32_03710 [Acinetobacter sp. 194]|uniref:hypothetical protein n=1 Tax=Acinetobacter shaoyimingii TaxID=2715164 RepID=UPI001408B563|nr:hypothetical protein [Acinetobacter shaoyimingii]NHB57138.1 hypothetical protein [Acinetobacter shaoyimingii]
MFKRIICCIIIGLQGCTPLATSYNDKNHLSNAKYASHSTLQNQLRKNMYRVSMMSNDEDLWDQPPSQYNKITIDALTLVEKNIYDKLEQSYLNGWVKCDGREYVWSSGGAFFFFEVKDYKPRFEIETLALTKEDKEKNIVWKGNMRIGFYQSLARDVVPHRPYTFLSINPHQSLPNFRWYSFYRNAYLQNETLYYYDNRDRKQLHEETPRKINCELVKRVLLTTTSE